MLPSIRRLGPVELDMQNTAQLTDAGATVAGGLSATNSSKRTELFHRAEKQILDDLEIIKDDEKMITLVRALAASRIETAFERIYGNIFQSQIDALTKLQNSHGGVPLKQAIDYFEENVKKKYPQAFGEGEFADWFRYLSNNLLAKIDNNNNVVLDVAGADFLTFLETKKNLPVKPL